MSSTGGGKPEEDRYGIRPAPPEYGPRQEGRHDPQAEREEQNRHRMERMMRSHPERGGPIWSN